MISTEMGECQVNTGDITIEQTDLQSIQAICGSIEDKDLKNRAVANALAVKTAAKYFDAGDYQIDDETGLYAFGDLFAEADIADLYINNCYVDVRLYFSKDELGVPKYHFEHDIKPVVYMFVKIAEDLSSAVISGFVKPENIDTARDTVQGFYPVREEDLESFYGIEHRLEMKLDENALSDAILYDFADGKFDNIYGIISALLSSKSSRYRLHKIFKAQSVYNMVSVTLPSVTEENAQVVQETVVNDISSELPVEGPAQEQDLNDDLEGLYNALDENDSDTDGNSDEIVNPDDNMEEALNYRTETTPSYSENEDDTSSGNNEQIDSLFGADEQSVVPVSSNKGGFIGMIIVLIIAAGLGGGAWWLYNHFGGSLPAANEIPSQTEISEGGNSAEPEGYAAEQPAEQDVAMPDETVENKPETTTKELGNSVAIPAIEKNLDASVLVSNLRVDWEVPEGYVSNTAAKRYLVKLGKVIQLNLKTDLLLLSKPPISNRIAVEITFDQSSGRFVFANLLSSSGEKTVDDAIIETIKTALSMSMSANTESFAKLKGNPVLIIHL